MNYFNVIHPLCIENCPSIISPISNQIKGIFLNGSFSLPIPLDKTKPIILKMEYIKYLFNRTEPLQVVFSLPLIYKILDFIKPERDYSIKSVESTILKSLSLWKNITKNSVYKYNLVK